MGLPDCLNVKKLTDLRKKLKESEKMSKRKLKTKCLAKDTLHTEASEMCKSDPEHRERNGSLIELPKIAENSSRDSAEFKVDSHRVDTEQHKVLFETLVSIGERLDSHRRTCENLSQQLSKLSAAESDLTMTYKDTLNKIKQLKVFQQSEERTVKKVDTCNQMDWDILNDENKMPPTQYANTQVSVLCFPSQAPSRSVQNLSCLPHPLPSGHALCYNMPSSTLQQHPAGTIRESCQPPPLANQHLVAASSKTMPSTTPASNLCSGLMSPGQGATQATLQIPLQVYGSTPMTQVAEDHTLPHGQGKGGHGAVTRSQVDMQHYDLSPTQKELYPASSSQAGVIPANLQLPMVEVPGPHGDCILLQRLWTPEEISQYATTLKKPEELGGERWQKELQAFCRTYRPTMREVLSICAKILDPSKMRDILTAMELYVDAKPAATQYNLNYEFLSGLRVLCGEIVRLYPKRVDLDAVRNCTQKTDETIAEFYHRLQTAINTHGGFEDPTSNVAMSYLTTLMLCNMREELSTAVKSSLIEAEFSEPAEVFRHARYAEKRQNEMNLRDEKQRKSDTFALQLSMTETQKAMAEVFNKMVLQLSQSTFKDGQKVEEKRHVKQNDSCFYCHSPQHWRSRCPILQKKARGHPQQGWRSRRDQQGFYDQREQIYYPSIEAYKCTGRQQVSPLTAQRRLTGRVGGRRGSGPA